MIEVPYLADLVTKKEFDTIYHQHLRYFTMTSLEKLLTRANLCITRAERISIQGGSLRLFVSHGRSMGETAAHLIEEEQRQGWHEFASISRTPGKVAEALSRELGDLIHTLRLPETNALRLWCGGKGHDTSRVVRSGCPIA